MYFSMDEIGFENTEKIRLIQNESMRWKFIYEIAKEYGFKGRLEKVLLISKSY